MLTTGLHKYEFGAIDILTRNKFSDVRKEIENVVALNVIQRTKHNNTVYLKLNKLCIPSIEFIVILYKSDADFIFDCQLYSRVVSDVHSFFVP